jgi:hypothetical protein
VSLRRSFNDAIAENDSGNGMLAGESVTTWVEAEAQQVARTMVRGAIVYRTVLALVELRLCTNDADDACNNRFRLIYLIAEAIDKAFSMGPATVATTSACSPRQPAASPVSMTVLGRCWAVSCSIHRAWKMSRGAGRSRAFPWPQRPRARQPRASWGADPSAD